METLLEKGVTFKMLIRHYIFQLEVLSIRDCVDRLWNCSSNSCHPTSVPLGDSGSLGTREGYIDHGYGQRFIRAAHAFQLRTDQGYR